MSRAFSTSRESSRALSRLKSRDEFELPFMAADGSGDYVGIHAQSDIAGEDGHAVNSGAPPSNTSEVFLQLTQILTCHLFYNQSTVLLVVDNQTHH